MTDKEKLKKLRKLAERLPSMHDQHGVVDQENMSGILEQKGVWFTCSYCLGIVHSRSEKNSYTGHKSDCVFKWIKGMFGLPLR